MGYKTKEQERSYRAANRERINKRQRERYAANPEKHRKEARDWAKANPEKVKEMESKRVRIWIPSEENRERSRTNQQKRRGKVDSGRRKGVRQSKDVQYAKEVKPKRKSYLKKAYNLTLEEWNDMATKQEGRCAICGKHRNEIFRGLMVDHDHKTGKVRGLLCHNCNAGMGNLRDDIQILQKAIEYLQSSY